MIQGMKLLAVLAALVCSATALGGTGPRVRLADRSPATVVGTSFHRGESVRVVLSSGDVILRRTVTANSRGAFFARWARALPVGCDSTGIVATGSAGSHAVLKLPAPECAPLQPVDR